MMEQYDNERLQLINSSIQEPVRQPAGPQSSGVTICPLTESESLRCKELLSTPDLMSPAAMDFLRGQINNLLAQIKCYPAIKARRAGTEVCNE